jgi:N-acetylmuramoyl-L-alanine amidase
VRKPFTARFGQVRSAWLRWLAVAVPLLAVAVALLALAMVSDHPSRPVSGGHRPAPDGPPTAAGPTSVLTRRASFAPGACVRFPPTHGHSGVTVFVDPGHGGIDPGAIGSRAVEEKNLNLAIGLDLLRVLRQDGDTVAMSRTTDTLVTRLGPGVRLLSPAELEVDLQARVACANASGAQVLLGIHLNGFSDPSVGGAETIYGAGRSFSARSRGLARAVETNVVRVLAVSGWQVPSRGVAPDIGQGAPGLTAQSIAYGHLMELGPANPPYFVYPSRMPGVIAEPLFITNPSEASVAAGVPGQQALARGLAAGVQSWLLARPARPGVVSTKGRRG